MILRLLIVSRVRMMMSAKRRSRRCSIFSGSCVGSGSSIWVKVQETGILAGGQSNGLEEPISAGEYARWPVV